MSEMTVEQFEAFLTGAAGKLTSEPFPEAIEATKPIVLQKVRDNFNSSATPEGSDWPPRKPHPDDDGHPLLIDTGAMMQAAVGQGQGHLELNEGRALLLGVDGQVIPYAATHQHGDRTRNIPSRKFFGINEETEKNCVQPISDAVTKKVFPEQNI